MAGVMSHIPQQQYLPHQHVQVQQHQQQQQQYEQRTTSIVKDINGVPHSLIFELEVAQQPDRARMCGFGDKDRRPITPPPCVRLIMRDAHTGEEVNYDEFDSSNYVCSVDIWSSDGQQPQNEVKHSNTSPSVSISMASLTSYPPPPDHTSVSPYLAQQMSSQYNQYGVGGRMGYGYANAPYYGPTGTFQRNLIGSLSVSATHLTDTQNKSGCWFVLQDLSVRTEGVFRLRLSFMNLSLPLTIPGQQTPYMPGTTTPTRTPILASAFTEPFQVFSAKKFPGVKESTELSKKFANQGVKIPIRKDGGGPGTRKRGSEEVSGDEQ